MNDSSFLRRHSRNDRRIHIIQIPPTTDACIVFPFNEQNETFNRNFYSPILTEGRASREEINKILGQFETTIQAGRTGYKILTCLFTIFFIGGFIFTAFLTFSIFSSDPSSKEIFYPPIIMFVLFTIFGCILSMRGKAVGEEARMACQQIINGNHQFNAVGLRWNLPMNFPAWVELWRDYRSAPGRNQNLQIAPNYPYPQYQNNYPEPAGFYAPPPPADSFHQDP